nr:MAG TPA: hypothetical protein [Crassvirales sp.]
MRNRIISIFADSLDLLSSSNWYNNRIYSTMTYFAYSIIIYNRQTILS